MPISDDPLLAALLALDSYNRGEDAGLKVIGTMIGDAEFLENVLPPSGSSAAGFFAGAYSWKQETIISYRGTDVAPSLFNTASWTDIPAWAIWLQQDYDAAQAHLAVDFFRSIQQSIGGTIETTGHSLGGALAGFVSSLFGVRGTTFDNIDFRNAL